MEALCTHRNDKLRKRAFQALGPFISQVSHELIRDVRNPESNKKTFVMLKDRISLMLDPKRANKYKLAMAICAFGQLATPIKKFLGQDDSKILLLKLFNFAEQLNSR